MRIRMLQDFRGRETNEAFYARGQVIDVEDRIAERLVSDGRAVYENSITSGAEMLGDATPSLDPKARRPRKRRSES